MSSEKYVFFAKERKKIYIFAILLHFLRKFGIKQKNNKKITLFLLDFFLFMRLLSEE